MDGTRICIDYQRNTDISTNYYRLLWPCGLRYQTRATDGGLYFIKHQHWCIFIRNFAWSIACHSGGTDGSRLCLGYVPLANHVENYYPTGPSHCHPASREYFYRDA